MFVTRDSQGTEPWNYITIFVNPESNKLHVYAYSSFKPALSKQCWMSGRCLEHLGPVLSPIKIFQKWFERHDQYLPLLCNNIYKCMTVVIIEVFSVHRQQVMIRSRCLVFNNQTKMSNDSSP